MCTIFTAPLVMSRASGDIHPASRARLEKVEANVVGWLNASVPMPESSILPQDSNRHATLYAIGFTIADANPLKTAVPKNKLFHTDTEGIVPIHNYAEPAKVQPQAVSISQLKDELTIGTKHYFDVNARPIYAPTKGKLV